MVYNKKSNFYSFRGKQNFCRDLRSVNFDVFNSFARWIRFVYGDEQCFNHSYEDRVELAINENWNQPGTNSGCNIVLDKYI